MGPLFSRRNVRHLLTAILLVALACRALVPVGFMPAGHGSHALMICHEGMPDHGHAPGSGGSSHSDHCPFGAAPGMGPVSSLFAAAAPAPVAPSFVQFNSSHTFSASRPRAHAPRGPPQIPSIA